MNTASILRGIPDGGASSPDVSPTTAVEERSVLEKLLHALNQPITGLQCSMEVALAAPRTAEHYVRTLQEGIELTDRLRVLAGAIREVVTGRELVVQRDRRSDSTDPPEAIDLRPLVNAVVGELAPVAQAAKVRMVDDFSCVSFPRVRARHAILSKAIFRLLESALSLAEPGSAVGIEISQQSAEISMRIYWTTAEATGPLPLGAIGILVGQAALEQAGAQSELYRKENSQTLSIRLPGLSASGNF